jgi:uncharacterized membrane-anchored protein YitT (DUF2179 family)
MAVTLKTKFGQIIWDYFVMTLGAFIYVVAWTSFMTPRGLASGGLTGLCAIIQYATNGVVPIAWTFPSINAVLIIAATIILGKGFGFRTIYVILVSTLLFEIMPRFEILYSLPGRPLYISEEVLIPIIGGLMEAVGLSLILLRGGSTGGTDILALIVNKFWPITLGRFYVMADLIIITLLIFVPGHCFTDVVYGYITMGVCAYVLDLIMLGKESAVQVLIFSNHYEAIGNYVTKEMERGVTALQAIGWYTQEDRKVLMVMIRKTEMTQLVKAVKEVDPKAFVTVVPANNVYGEGFSEMKTGIPKRKKK